MRNRYLKLLKGPIVLLLLMVLGCQPEQQKSTDNQPLNDKISEIQDGISTDLIEANIRKLSSFYTRHTLSDTASDSVGIGAARRWIYDSFQRYSTDSDNRLQVKYDRYIESDHPQVDASTEIVNVVAMLPGTQLESKDRMYVVSGHYDSRTSDIKDSESQATGANDNATGTASVLELARVMSNYKFDATIVFIAFAGKEQGLLGSKYFADQSFLKNRNIAAVINNDIIGNELGDSDKNKSINEVRVFTQGVPANLKFERYHQMLLNTGGENDTPSRQLGRFIHRIGKKYMDDLSVNLVYRKDRLWKKGDHFSFLEQGNPAVRVTEAGEDFDRQHQEVGKQEGRHLGDLPDFVNFDYTARVTQLNAAALATLADAPAPPQQVEIAIKKSSPNAHLQWKGNKEPDFKGYEIVWRNTQAPHWQHTKFVGDTLEYSVDEVNKDDHIFGVRSIDNYDNKSPAVYPVPTM